MTDRLHYASLTEIAAKIASGEITSLAVTEHMLARIAALNPSLCAFAAVTEDISRAQAQAADRALGEGRLLGPLHGVPIALKDLCSTQGIVTAAGMPIHANHVPDNDATVTARLLAAGAVLLGKLQMTEGAFSAHHPDIPVPINPWGAALWSGVSSSGSGVATAAGLCYASLGSDTGGSIRFPSTAQGLTGIKPSWGRVSRHGIFDLAPSLDHIGPMARSARDAAAILAVIAGHDPADPTSLAEPVPEYLADSLDNLTGRRVGLDTDYCFATLDQPTRAAFEIGLQQFADLGADIVEIHFPDITRIVEDWVPLCAHEAALAHGATYPAQRSAYGPALSALLDFGLVQKPDDLADMNRHRMMFRDELDDLLARVDLLACPSQFIAGPTNQDIAELRQRTEGGPGLRRFTVPFDMSGHPTITFPCGFTDSGAPIAMQLAAGYDGEAKMVAAADLYQTHTRWHQRHPDI